MIRGCPLTLFYSGRLSMVSSRKDRSSQPGILVAMNRLLILLILFGSQVGLSDFLLLPVYAARHGELTFLALFALFKLVIVLPLLHAELVAGRYYRVSPFELVLDAGARRWGIGLLVALLLAVLFVVANNLHNAAWALAVGQDALAGGLAGFDSLDRVLYWYDLGSDRVRLGQGMLVLVGLLAAIAWFAWHGIALVYALILPLCLALVLTQSPHLVDLWTHWGWRPTGVDGVFLALQYALTSSIAGFMVWYLVGCRLPQSLPTGRWVLSVQLFDLLLGIVIVATVMPGPEAMSRTADSGIVLQALVERVADGGLTADLTLFLALAATIGALGSLPLLLLVTLAVSGRTHRGGLLLMLTAALLLGLLALVSAQAFAPLTWYGMPLTDVLNWFGFSVVAPVMAALTAIWVGWGLSPNQVLKQVNPKTGGRYLAWRFSVKFVIPLALALTFARATLGLGGVTVPWILGAIVSGVLLWRVGLWLKRQALYPHF